MLPNKITPASAEFPSGLPIKLCRFVKPAPSALTANTVPLPELPPSNAAKARQKILIDMARTENLSIRQLAHRFAQATGHHVLVGTPAYMADVMEHWFMEGGADGYTVLQPHYPQPLEDFVELVIPELQRRGIFRMEYSGTTLRENLGVPFPENRFMKSARA